MMHTLIHQMGVERAHWILEYVLRHGRNHVLEPMKTACFWDPESAVCYNLLKRKDHFCIHGNSCFQGFDIRSFESHIVLHVLHCIGGEF